MTFRTIGIRPGLARGVGPPMTIGDTTPGRFYKWCTDVGCRSLPREPLRISAMSYFAGYEGFFVKLSDPPVLLVYTPPFVLSTTPIRR